MARNLLLSKNHKSPIDDEELTEEQERKLRLIADRLEKEIIETYAGIQKERQKRI